MLLLLLLLLLLLTVLCWRLQCCWHLQGFLLFSLLLWRLALLLLFRMPVMLMAAQCLIWCVGGRVGGWLAGWIGGGVGGVGGDGWGVMGGVGWVDGSPTWCLGNLRHTADRRRTHPPPQEPSAHPGGALGSSTLPEPWWLQNVCVWCGVG